MFLVTKEAGQWDEWNPLEMQQLNHREGCRRCWSEGITTVNVWQDVQFLRWIYLTKFNHLWVQYVWSVWKHLEPLFCVFSKMSLLFCNILLGKLWIFTIMCPVGASPLRGSMKRGSCQPSGLIALYHSAWIGWLCVVCVAASPSGQLLNSLSATRLQVATDSYGYSDERHPFMVRHRSSLSSSSHRSPATLKGGHGEWGRF